MRRLRRINRAKMSLLKTTQIKQNSGSVRADTTNNTWNKNRENLYWRCYIICIKNFKVEKILNYVKINHFLKCVKIDLQINRKPK